MMPEVHKKYILEAALLCSTQPLSMADLRILFDDTLTSGVIEQLLQTVADDWDERGMELVQVANGWRFQSKIAIREQLQRLRPEKPQKYSRATLETLAIIAWRQPVTRAEIEDIRGVAVSSHIVKQLQERDWIEVVGYKAAVGRPALLATTQQFLNDLGLSSLSDLPPIDTTEADALMAQIQQREAENHAQDPLALQAELPITVDDASNPDGDNTPNESPHV